MHQPHQPLSSLERQLFLYDFRCSRNQETAEQSDFHTHRTWLIDKEGCRCYHSVHPMLTLRHSHAMRTSTPGYDQCDFTYTYKYLFTQHMLTTGFLQVMSCFTLPVKKKKKKKRITPVPAVTIQVTPGGIRGDIAATAPLRLSECQV